MNYFEVCRLSSNFKRGTRLSVHINPDLPNRSTNYSVLQLGTFITSKRKCVLHSNFGNHPFFLKKILFMMALKALLQFPCINHQREELHTSPLFHPLLNLHISLRFSDDFTVMSVELLKRDSLTYSLI